MTDELHIDSIKVGLRHRRDLGDTKALAHSIDTIGLIHPVPVTPDHQLVAGERRLAAMRELGWNKVPVTIVRTLADAAAMLQAECDENTCRKDFTPSEAAAVRAEIAKMLAPIVEQERREAISDARRGDPPNLGESQHARETGRIAAQGTGYSGPTLDKVDKIIEAAQDETQPEPVREAAQEAITEMNQTGKVDPAFKKVQEAKEEAGTLPESKKTKRAPLKDNLQLRELIEGLWDRDGRPPRNVDVIAAAVSAGIDTGKSATPVREAITYVGGMRAERAALEPVIESEDGPEETPAWGLLVIGKRGRTNHRKNLDNMLIHHVEPLPMVLDEIKELDGTVKAEEALQLSKRLAEPIRALNRINKQLKERSSK